MSDSSPSTSTTPSGVQSTTTPLTAPTTTTLPRPPTPVTAGGGAVNLGASSILQSSVQASLQRRDTQPPSLPASGAASQVNVIARSPATQSSLDIVNRLRDDLLNDDEMVRMNAVSVIQSSIHPPSPAEQLLCLFLHNSLQLKFNHKLSCHHLMQDQQPHLPLKEVVCMSCLA